jgi:CubicO group peptidase (beta-lactamase class C family)
LAATARDLIRFARLHLDEGEMAPGHRLLSVEGVRAMQRHHATFPWCPGIEGIGLGWRLQRWGDLDVVGHDGANMGQFAQLRIVPARRFAVALLSNSAWGEALWDEVVGTLAPDLMGVARRPSPAPSRSTKTSRLPATTGATYGPGLSWTLR